MSNYRFSVLKGPSGGLGFMSKGERYREHAADCARLSTSVCDDQARTVLLHMATAWLRLAECAEQTGRPACASAAPSRVQP